jgi:hypothetical protein
MTKDSTTGRPPRVPQATMTTPSTKGSTPKVSTLSASTKLGKAFTWCTLEPHPTQTRGRHTLPPAMKCHRGSPPLPTTIAKCAEDGTLLPMPRTDFSSSAMETGDTPHHPNDLIGGGGGAPSPAHSTRCLLHHGDHPRHHAKQVSHPVPEKVPPTNGKQEPPPPSHAHLCPGSHQIHVLSIRPTHTALIHCQN